MPSLPTVYSRASTPSYDNRRPQTLGNTSPGPGTTQSFGLGMAEKSDSMSSLCCNGLLSPPNPVQGLARRPPLPPTYNHHRRPISGGHVSGNSSPMLRSPSPSSVSSFSLSRRARSLTARSVRSPPSVASSPSRSQLGSPTFSTPPRRTYPRESSMYPPAAQEGLSKEQAPVVFDASLNFVLGCERQRVKQSFRPTASHLEPSTASSYLSSKISQFLKRTDHIMDEWRSLGHKDEAEDEPMSLPNQQRDMPRITIGRSQSATNIMIRGFQYFSRSNSIGKSLSRHSLSRASEDRTLSDGLQELSEMTADFAEEHSTSTLAAERIDAETSERLRLERELQDVTEANKNLQQTTERLEMELLYARAADLNGVASDGEEGEDGGVYRQRYEHAIRELEFTKRKMAQQHEDDLEQLVGLKKQLEKKLADAYEEVEEQRQVVGQWKRRVQKLNGEMHDLRLLLEEQTARNNLLEKKQRKFDSETQNLMNDLRQEKAQRERLAREKEIAIAEKFTVEQNLSDARLEIELKEERLRTLTQELEELTFGGKTEEEVAQLKKAKHELEKRAKDQEEELDDLAGQVQLLEQAKLRLEMSIEQQRKEMRKEMQQRDEELEDVRGNAHKKVKALESQLENEHEERTILLREKHELERRLVAIEEQDRADRAAEAETMQRLKRDLKRTRALLRDAQTMLERSKGDSTGKAALRQLKNQLEDAECARAAAIKAKQALEQELNETQATLEEAMRQRSEAEERANAANRERTELLSQLEENEEELAEVLKKYRAAVQQVSAEQGQLQEAQVQIAALEAEKSSLKDQLAELTQRLESVEQLGDPTANSLATRRLEFRAKELESKLELEQTTRARLETQIARLKESVDKLQTESALLRTKEQTAQDAARRLQRSLRDARDEASAAISREQEALRARRDIEKSLEAAEAETKVARDDLRLALQRIDDLQSAIQGELDLDCSEEATSENSDSD
ncbi:unconventional myosin-XVIIIa isoform X4 [Harpegnathos saltator]|uniref:unconventional myosin-XVIIIa isoform X4 n=1 Tax=Harpegnathos saltator TaxID=610380 RepID=UPI00058EE1AC|nr:unconventional myosin-XVIIIa isoform X4 [Harpegnathos saltator]